MRIDNPYRRCMLYPLRDSSQGSSVSFTFRIECPRPTVDSIQMAMKRLSLRCLEDLPPTGPWPVGHFHFYRDRVSTRTTEVVWDGKTFCVRVFTLACPEDYHIAVELAASTAGALTARVEPEDLGDLEPLPPNELRKIYDTIWAESMCAAMAQIMCDMAVDENKEITIPGPIREFYLGPKTAAECIAAGPSTELQERVVSRMRALQYPSDDLFEASLMSVPSHEDRLMQMAIWGPEVRYFFPKVEYLVLLNEHPLYLPYEKAQVVGAERVRFLDEHQFVVEAVADEEWDSFLDRARPHLVDPFERPQDHGNRPD
jgi:hypothetical protein